MTSTSLCVLVALVASISACGSNDSPANTSDAGGWASVTCSNSSNVTKPTGDCSRGYSGCSDGHSYAIDCTAGLCNCQIDTLSTGRATTLTCGADGLAGLAANCGWHQH